MEKNSGHTWTNKFHILNRAKLGKEMMNLVLIPCRGTEHFQPSNKYGRRVEIFFAFCTQFSVVAQRFFSIDTIESGRRKFGDIDGRGIRENRSRGLWGGW